MLRTAIFGGTFDPPHLGHLSIARSALDFLAVDEVLWVVTPDPPHKTGTNKSAFVHRFAMSRLCVADQNSIQVSDLENSRPGPHFTLDTIKILKSENPDNSYSLLIGGDSLQSFHTWHAPHSILTEIEFLGVFSRSGIEGEFAEFSRNFADFVPKLVWIKADAIYISSSHIREMTRIGEDASEYVTPQVWEYIKANNLYSNAQDVIAAAR